MKLVVISPEGEESRERTILGQMLGAGLERYHVRKPTWSVERLSAWIRTLPEGWRKALVLHGHSELARSLGLGGSHAILAEGEGAGARFTSRSCHTLRELEESLGRYDAVFFGPLYPSFSKPGYGPGPAEFRTELASLLSMRTAPQRRTEVIALGGITPNRILACRELGFDAAAVIGAIWRAADPFAVYLELRAAAESEGALAEERLRQCPIMCLTQDGLPLSHAEQARRLTRAGARFIQLRMKGASPAQWLSTAREVAGICREAGARLIVNDQLEIALAAGADGVHLGSGDGDWSEARKKLGPNLLLGGTVNNASDAARAVAAACLDYVGVGPLRFTTTKDKLAPVLGIDGVARLISELDGLPAWVIGGVQAADLAAIRGAGASGAAVSSALYRGGEIEANYARFHNFKAEPSFAS